MTIESDNDAPRRCPPRLVRRFRSATSGLWYENPRAAGSINAVELDGQILERHEGEQTMPWIRRAAEWAEAIHLANAAFTGLSGEMPCCKQFLPGGN